LYHYTYGDWREDLFLHDFGIISDFRKCSIGNELPFPKLLVHQSTGEYLIYLHLEYVQ
jgi:hypothetical protein